MSNIDKELNTSEKRLFGVAAEFDTVDKLIQAANKVRLAGYTKWDSHTPFPVHGLDKAMGVRATVLPWITLAFGLTGLGCAILMQWWMNSVDYPFAISGKPNFSLPANIPVAFELTVLFSAFSTFFGVLGLNKLPEWFHPVHTLERFKRASADRFFIVIEAQDTLFDADKTAVLLKSAGASAVDALYLPPKHTFKFPKKFAGAALVIGSLALLPFGFAARARVSTSPEPRIHVVYDMDHQTKYKAQSANPFFKDGVSDREPIAGTVAVGELHEDTAFYQGKEGDKFITEFPAAFVINAEKMQRGQERFRVYCAPCHGLSGKGDGTIAQRAEELQEGKWVPPTSIHADNVVKEELGELFNTITYGIRNMPAYGAQIPAEDRWAILLYVKALQRSQNAAVSDVPADQLPMLK